MTIAELEVIITGRIDKLESELGAAKVAIEGFAKESSAKISEMAMGMATSCGNVGRMMTSAITVPLVAIAGASVKLSADFEDSMAKVEGAAGVAHDEVMRLRDGVLNLSKDTAVAPKELGEGLFYVASMGHRGAAAMDILSRSSHLSAAGFGNTAELAKVTTFAINAYGEKNLTAAKAADVLAAAVREGAMPTDALAGSLGRVLPEAARMGVSFDQLCGSLAAMTRIGLDVSEGVTGIRATMMTLDHPSKQTVKALDEVGLKAKDVAKAMSHDLIGTLGVLAKASEKGGETFQRIFPNIRAFTGVLALTGTHAAETQRLLDSVANSTGSADKAFQVASKTAGFQFRQALADLKVSGIELGDTLAPVAKEIAEKVKTACDAFQKMSPQAKQMAVDFLAITAVVGPLLVAFSGVTKFFLNVIELGSKIGPFLAGIGTAFTEAGGAAGILGTAIEVLSGPIGWCIAIGAALYAAWVNDWGGIREFVADTVKEIVGWWKSELPKIQEITKWVVDKALVIWEHLKAYWSGLWQAVVSILGFAWDTIKVVITTALRLIENTISFWTAIFTGRWADAFENMKNVALTIWAAIVRIVLAGAKGVLGAIQGITNAVGGMFGADKWKGLDDSMKAIDKLSAKYTDMGKAAGGAGDKVKGLAKNVANSGAAAIAAGKKNPKKDPGITLGSPSDDDEDGGGKKKESAAAKAAREHLEQYRDTIQTLTKNIAMLGQEQEWEQAIVERKYGKYKDYTNAEWQHIYALVTKHEKIKAVMDAEEAAKKAKDDAAKKAAKAAEELKQQREQAFQQIQTSLKAKERELALMGVETEYEKTLYDVRSGSLKNASGMQIMYALAIAKASDAKQHQLDVEKENIEALKGAHQMMILANPALAVADWLEKTKAAQDADFPKYIKSMAVKMQELTTTTREQAIAVEMNAKFWMLGKDKIKQAIDATITAEKLDKWHNLMKQMSDTMSKSFMDGLSQLKDKGFGGFFSSVLTGFEKMIGDMAQQWLQSQILMGMMKFLGGSSSLATSMPLGHKAVGGPVSSGKAYMVGEYGPELFVPNNSGTIRTNEQTMSGGGGGNVYMTVVTPDAGGFKRSQSQIMTDMGHQMRRNMRRNG